MLDTRAFAALFSTYHGDASGSNKITAKSNWQFFFYPRSMFRKCEISVEEARFFGEFVIHVCRGLLFSGLSL